jgi:hypothetical protein
MSPVRLYHPLRSWLCVWFSVKLIQFNVFYTFPSPYWTLNLNSINSFETKAALWRLSSPVTTSQSIYFTADILICYTKRLRHIFACVINRQHEKASISGELSIKSCSSKYTDMYDPAPQMWTSCAALSLLKRDRNNKKIKKHWTKVALRVKKFPYLEAIISNG